MSVAITLTGDRQVDARMASFEAKVQRKYLRQAVNEGIKIVETDYKSLVPEVHGAMKDATRRRTPKRKRRGDVARALVIIRALYFKLYEARYGHPPGRRAGDSDPFFAPTVVELGDKDTPAQKPLRTALYSNEQRVKNAFINQLRAAVSAAGK